MFENRQAQRLRRRGACQRWLSLPPAAPLDVTNFPFRVTKKGLVSDKGDLKGRLDVARAYTRMLCFACRFSQLSTGYETGLGPERLATLQGFSLPRRNPQLRVARLIPEPSGRTHKVAQRNTARHMVTLPGYDVKDSTARGSTGREMPCFFGRRTTAHRHTRTLPHTACMGPSSPIPPVYLIRFDSM